MSTMFSSGFISAISPAPIARNNFPKSDVLTLLGDPSTDNRRNAPDNSVSNSELVRSFARSDVAKASSWDDDGNVFFCAAAPLRRVGGIATAKKVV